MFEESVKAPKLSCVGMYVPSGQDPQEGSAAAVDNASQRNEAETKVLKSTDAHFQQQSGTDIGERSVAPQALNNGRSKNQKPIRVCPFFASVSGCRYGSGCRNRHETLAETEPHKRDSATGTCNEEVQNTEKPSKQHKSGAQRNEVTSPKKEVCRYYQRGYCWSGKRCKFAHIPRQNKTKKSDDSTIKMQAEKTEVAKITSPDNVAEQDEKTIEVLVQDTSGLTHEENIGALVQDIASTAESRNITKRPTLLLKDLTERNLSELRDTELCQLQKHFPEDRLTKIDWEEGAAFQLLISPTDPDWSYDMDTMEMFVSFPTDYPKEVCYVEFSEELDGEQIMPSKLALFLTQESQTWLNDRLHSNNASGKIDLMFRPFLRWLDRNFVDLVTEGLKRVKLEMESREAGIEFVPWENLRISTQQESLSSEPDRVDPNLAKELPHVTVIYGKKDSGLERYEAPKAEKSSAEQPAKQESFKPITELDTTPRGIEMKFQQVELGEPIATIMAQKISVVVRCGRCKAPTTVTTPARRVNGIDCSKCHQSLIVSYRATMMHQYSSVMGYLDLKDCAPFDLVLVDCDFLLGCFDCSKEMSFSGFHFGQPQDIWCQHCHNKMTIKLETIKFQYLIPGELHLEDAGIHKITANRQKKQELWIKEGYALPENGICKHYKKSYRWMRFPCCGKCYPCDKCHDESEDGHEMMFATRMICGFCSKEQPFSKDKPCTGCKSSVTKSFTSHWEGGTGCRNKVKMSRTDAQKYASLNKTTSRKQQELKKKPASKKT